MQSTLPVRFLCPVLDLSLLIRVAQHKEFEIGDVVANLLGSSVGLYISYHLERYYRHRREVLDELLDLDCTANRSVLDLPAVPTS